MTIYNLSHIKSLRRKYHLTQKQLAERAGVSQSLVAKIEAGRLDPSYSKAQQILQSLEELRNARELKAKDVMQSKIVTAAEPQKVQEIIKVMRSRGISQVPVLRQGNIVGMVSEGAILTAMAEHPERIQRLHVRELMEEAPPIVAPTTGLKMLLELLKDYPAVLVAEKGELRGIISKTDVLGRG